LGERIHRQEEGSTVRWETPEAKRRIVANRVIIDCVNDQCPRSDSARGFQGPLDCFFEKRFADTLTLVASIDS